jgi:hypothetical protein
LVRRGIGFGSPLLAKEGVRGRLIDVHPKISKESTKGTKKKGARVRLPLPEKGF